MLVMQEGLWKFWPITATEVEKSGVTEHSYFESTHGNSVQTSTKYERQVQVNLNISPVLASNSP
jgi:phage/plasmid-associated DNA primase